MTGLKGKLKELFVSEEGATATEYAVMLALIIVVSIAAITAIGTRVNSTFEKTRDALPAAP